MYSTVQPHPIQGLPTLPAEKKVPSAVREKKSPDLTRRGNSHDKRMVRLFEFVPDASILAMPRMCRLF